jgi:hypothetical protein
MVAHSLLCGQARAFVAKTDTNLRPLCGHGSWLRLSTPGRRGENTSSDGRSMGVRAITCPEPWMYSVGHGAHTGAS